MTFWPLNQELSTANKYNARMVDQGNTCFCSEATTRRMTIRGPFTQSGRLPQPQVLHARGLVHCHPVVQCLVTIIWRHCSTV